MEAPFYNQANLFCNQIFSLSFAIIPRHVDGASRSAMLVPREKGETIRN